MAWSYGNVGSSASAADNATLNVSYPSSIAAGNLLLLLCSCRTLSNTMSTPSGWTFIKGIGSSGSAPGAHALWGKIATGGETGSQAVTTSGGDTARWMGQMARFTGAPSAVTGNIHATVHYVNASGQDIPIQPLSIGNADTLVIATGMIRWIFSSEPVAPTGFTLIDVEQSDNNQMTQAWAYQIQTTASNIGSGLKFDSSDTNTADGATTTISLLAGATTTKYLKALIASAAAGTSGVAGTVFNAPSGADITGNKIGEFTGQSFLGTSSLDGGKAKLLVAATAFGGTSLTTSDAPVVYLRTSSFDTGIFPATVIEV